MQSTAYLFLFCLSLRAFAAPPAQARFRNLDEEDGCPTGVHIVGVRGTTEEHGFGAMQPLVDQILSEIPDSDSYAIDYPASGITVGDNGELHYQPIQYITSVQKGRASLQSELIDFNLFCPNSSVILLGYSQV
jgi:acetylxylan esterase